MSIVSLSEALEFLDITEGYFEISTINNTMSFTSNRGGPSDVNISANNYRGAELASNLQSQMNSNTTITGGLITFSVSYSDTTNKFTIDAGTGNTIALDYSESDAAFTLGFTEDASAAESITSNSGASDPTSIITTIRDAVEDHVQNTICRRTFEETSYTLERHDWTGSRLISLNNFPIVTLDRVAIGTIDVMKIKNTNEYTSASVSVSSTGLRLVYNGTASSDDLTFATNTTLTAMNTAVNAVSGWESELLSSGYGTMRSADLIDRYAVNAIDDNWVSLEIPDEAEEDVTVYPDRGQVYLNSYGADYDGYTHADRASRNIGYSRNYIRRNRRDIFVDYSAGYSSSDMPTDLKLAVNILVSYFYNRKESESFGLGSYDVGKIRASFLKTESLPKEAIKILLGYGRMRI